MPGFANMVQGELGGAADADAHQRRHLRLEPGRAGDRGRGRCIELGDARWALAVGSEMPSRLFKRSRFAARGYDADFDAHFLRWMLSDGAGALLLSHREPLGAGDAALRLRLKWVHQHVLLRRLPGVHAAGPDLEDARAATSTTTL